MFMSILSYLRLRPDLIPDVHMEVRYKSSISDFSQLSIGVFLADMQACAQ